MSSRRVLIPVAIALLVTLVACSGGGKKSSSSSATTTTIAATTTTAPPISPLTGQLATDRATLLRPALVVKIDNADGSGGNSARPQLGVNQADIVYEEMVEGSVTRLAAIFQSQGSDPVGPVRSARTSDVAVFSPLRRPLFAWSGANPDFAEIIRNSPLIDVGYEAASDAYARRSQSGHAAPHNLYSSTTDLFALAPPDAVPPSPLFSYRAAGAAPAATGTPVGSLHLVWGAGPGSAPVDWTWSAATGQFLRDQRGTPDVDENGVQVGPANVVVLFVGYHDTGYTDVVGTPVPEADLVGTGACWIMTGGMLVEGTWSKSAPEAITTYLDATGAPIALTPGQTWVELSPEGSATRTS
ncbi:MAG: DUF3048 domain-containing protein [Acidimicrobiales bacterium]